MLYMNDYDLAFARRRFTASATPNRLALVLVVDNLREWANDHSDGWAYWPKPCNAAKRAMMEIRSTTNAANDAQERSDISDADLQAAVRPIKAFLTRAKVTPEDRERILRAATAPTEI